MKILFFIENLGSGGAERVVASLSNELSERGYKVIIVTDLSKEPKYRLLNEVEIIDIKKNKVNKNKIVRAFTFIQNLRVIIKKTKPDVCIGVMPFSFFLVRLATIGLNVPIIASDHTSFQRKLPWYINFIRFKIYNYADAVTILTNTDFNYLGNKLKRKIVMPNPLSFDVNKNKVCFEKKKTKILAVGRVNEWEIKGFDILIKAWCKIAAMYPEWSLEICGEYNDINKLKLEKFIDEKCSKSRIVFSGFCANVEDKMRESAIFVLPSRIEGFGLVLIEAMSMGCACISFDSDGRQKEIIASFTDGIILEKKNEVLLAEAIEYLINNPHLRTELGWEAIKKSSQYSLNIVVDKWVSLINAII